MVVLVLNSMIVESCRILIGFRIHELAFNLDERSRGFTAQIA
jgi:hypothetical protein